MPRKLIDGTVVPDYPKEIRMTIASRCPTKWLFVDLETGDVWEYSKHAGYQFWSAPKDRLKAAMLAIKRALKQASRKEK